MKVEALNMKTSMITTGEKCNGVSGQRTKVSQIIYIPKNMGSKLRNVTS